MRPRFLPALLLALAAPLPATAQQFGSYGHGAGSTPGRVVVEILRDGRLFWLGRLGPGGERIELLARQPALRRCHDSFGVTPVVYRAHDSLNIELLPQPAPYEPERHVLRFDWRFVVPLASLPRYSMDACRESRQRVDTIAFEAWASLPPGERVRVDAQSGFEIFLTRDADAPPGVLARGSAGVPVRVDVDFDILVVRAGSVVWQGTLHQETVADKPILSIGASRPVTTNCLAAGRAPRCAGLATDRWELTVQLRNEVEIDFSAKRDDRLYDMEIVREDGTSLVQRNSETVRAVRRRLALAPGGTTTIVAGDFLIRIGRR